MVMAMTTIGQEDGYDRKKVFINVQDTIQLDSLSIVPNSLVIYDDLGEVDTSIYTLQAAKSIIVFKSQPQGELTVTYRVFPFSLSQRIWHKDQSMIRSTAGLQDPFKYKVSRKQNSIFGESDLEKRGSISRGITFGNSQNLSVNSNLNLQLAGRLSDELKILASISDENIPIQPDGNTQQLQDFDQVYIQVYNDKTKLIAGDYQTPNPKQSYFQRYLKRAQGGLFSTRIKTDNNVPDSLSPYHELTAGVAVSRGKFGRNIIQGVEGNQGPYRLRGSEGETFIIILSGTERVFIDGKLLTRGQENDYVINYNTAELTFTAKQFITKDKRIIVEFQYSDRNFARSVVQFSDVYQSERTKAFFSVYAEQDSKNQSLRQDLTDNQRSILQSIGDSLQDAFAPSINPVEFTPDLVLYKMLDSLGYDSVFVFSTNPDSAMFQLSFSEVGDGNGNYILQKSLANGKVYQWIAPDALTGRPMGSFEPVVLLVTPKQRQMIATGLEQKVGESGLIVAEAAISNRDLNNFSPINDGDNIGLAGKASYQQRLLQLGKKDTINGPWNISGNAGVEFWDNRFSPIERIRNVEFYRDWNLRDVELVNDQTIVSGGLKLQKKNRGVVEWKANRFLSGDQYNATRNTLNGKYKNRGWDLTLDASLLNSKSDVNESYFQRHKSLLKRQIGFFVLGYRDDYENNQKTSVLSDSLELGSYEFWEKEVFVSNPALEKNKYRLFYIQRRDKGRFGNDLRTATFAQSIGFDLELVKNRNHRFRTRNTYRKLEILNPEITTQTEDNTSSSRIEYQLRLLKGAFLSTSFVEVSSGLEARKDFSFIEVPTGQGIYYWNDYNGNGQKELDEFEIAQFSDQASYIKVFSPSDDYVKTYTNQFNQLLTLTPARLWSKKKKLLKLFSRFSNQFAYRLDRKTNEEDLTRRFNPLPVEISDTSLISIASNFRNTLYFNRTHPKFGADVGFLDLRSRSLLTNGFEGRSNAYYEGNVRWNVTRELLLSAKGKAGQKENSSELFATRNYKINYSEIEPKITFQPNLRVRWSVFVNYKEKFNAPGFGTERAFVRKIGSEAKVNFTGKGALAANVNLLNISYNSTSNDALAFEMLEGLQSGINATWSLLFQQTINKNFQLNLQYNGRQSEDTPTIHAGGVQLRVFF